MALHHFSLMLLTHLPCHPKSITWFVLNKQEIFQELGSLKSISIKTDSNGRSQGVAEVTFPTRTAATQAVSEYDGAEVDGKPMYLRLMEGNATGREKTHNQIYIETLYVCCT